MADPRRRLAPCAISAVLAWTSCGPGPGEPLRIPEHSNILLITVDTLRRDALGWIAEGQETPAIDGLAAEGFRFRTAAASVPLTLPSHATMMTGLAPHRHGVRDNGQVMNAGIPTLAGLLAGSGYRTAAFVSGYPLRSMFGIDSGFQHFDDELPGGDEGWLERAAPLTTNAALEWIGEAPSPWFVWVHYYDPHSPYEPPRNFWQPGPRGSYDGEVAYVDHAIAQLVQGLPPAARGRTLTVFTADHGEAFGEHEEWDHGMFVYDSTMLVPLVLHFPGVIPAAEGAGVPRLADLMPTLLELLDLAAPGDIDGISLAPALAGAEVEMPAAYLESRYPWTTFGWAPLRAWRTQRWKLIDAPRPELYDLQRDPGESTDVAAEHPEVVQRLMAALETAAAAPAFDSETLMDPEALERLRGLGYVGAGSTTADEPPGGLPDPKDRLDERNRLLAAETLLQSGKLREALAGFERVLQTDPDNRFAVLRSGITWLKLDDPRRAIPRLEQAVRLDPRQPESRFALADALTRAGEYERAIQQWQETVALQPRRVAAWSNLGSVLGWSGRMDEAIEAFLQATALDPEDPALWLNLANAEQAAGRSSAAAEHREAARALEEGRSGTGLSLKSP